MGGMIKTGGTGFVLLGAVMLVSFEGCMLFEQQEIVDIARNRYIYRAPTYVAPRQAEAVVYVARVLDKRTLPDVNTGASYREIYSDNVWDRLPPVMVEEVLIEAIDRSKIYSGISTGTAGKPGPKDVILRSTLLEMYRMREVMVGDEMTGQRRTVASTSIRIEIDGPEDAHGRRPILMDQTFQDVVATPPSLNKPEEGLVLAGRTMENIVKRMLQKIYESNDVGVASPASGGAEKGQPESALPKKTSPEASPKK